VAARAATWARWVPPSVWLAVVLQALFLVVDALTDSFDVARTGEAVRVALTFANAVAIFALLHLALRRAAARVATAAVLTFFVVANVCRQATMGAFDYGFVHDHAKDILTPLGRHLVVSELEPARVGLIALALAMGAVVVFKLPWRPWPGSRGARAAAVSACLGVLVGLPAANVFTHEAVTGFVVSMLHFHWETKAADLVAHGTRYPYVHELVTSPRALAARTGLAADAPRPHVIVLFLESWNGLFAGARRADGRPYTPVLDAHARDGLTIPRFYGNSIHSSRGHFATLCSLPPMYRGKEFTDLPATRLRCLPEMLRDAGWSTLFYSATSEPEFEGSQAFFLRIGFGEATFQDGTRRGHDPEFWGVGLEDDAFYRAFFATLDERLAREPGKPVFAAAANASHHYPFREDPAHVPDPDEATRYRRDYVGSLARSDAWLATFFDELDRRPALKGALVVVVGDHSFPADEHGIHFNMVGAYEEAFRTSALVRWPGHVEPGVLSDRAASQLDLAPTIADLLGLRGPAHFVGRSLFADADVDAAVPMVQPYDGVHLVAVRWPFKLVRHEAAAQEHLYDLARDPREEHDLVGSTAHARELAALRRAVVRIHANQALLRENRIWPPP
jgi:arylsulfatase A-like enzyme